MKRFILIAITIMCCYSLNAQNRNAVWCFGDSAGIDFSSGVPIPINTSLDTRGTCVSIADTGGQLLFYANTRANTAGYTTGLVWNRNHQLMQNGDSIAGNGWYNEFVIVPLPGSDSLFYLFSVGVTSEFWLKYCKIDITANGGLGAVTQKNIQLQSFPNVDCLNAIKHGNGRDWWLFFRRWDPNNLTPNNEFHSYLITPNGITNHSVQHVGSLSYTGLAKITFSPLGDKLVYNTYAGLLEIYDFDRCTGIISNPVNIFQETSIAPYNYFVGCEFSPNGNLLYVTIDDLTSYLFQFDLLAPTIVASIDTLWTTSYPTEAIGALKRGPDGKIYESGPYTSPLFYNYPYPDSVYNIYNMNLGVINSPDSLGAACDFQPYSFYLGGKRTYWGLPNNPDYDMPRLQGSPCDTIQWTGIKEQELTGKGQLYVSYISAWQKAFINAQHLKGKTYMITVTDMMGRMVYKSSSGSASTSLSMTHSGYFTMDLNCSSFSNGMYVVTLITDREMISQKFIRD